MRPHPPSTADAEIVGMNGFSDWRIMVLAHRRSAAPGRPRATVRLPLPITP